MAVVVFFKAFSLDRSFSEVCLFPLVPLSFFSKRCLSRVHAMASLTLRQMTGDFYVGRTNSEPSGADLGGFFNDSLRDLERRLTVKLFDLSRTLTNLTSEVRRTADLDGVFLLFLLTIALFFLFQNRQQRT